METCVEQRWDQVDKKDFPILLQGSALRKRYHPVKEYFASLAWDGVDRLPTMLHKYAENGSGHALSCGAAWPRLEWRQRQTRVGVTRVEGDFPAEPPWRFEHRILAPTPNVTFSGPQTQQSGRILNWDLIFEFQPADLSGGRLDRQGCPDVVFDPDAAGHRSVAGKIGLANEGRRAGQCAPAIVLNQILAAGFRKPSPLGP